MIAGTVLEDILLAILNSTAAEEILRWVLAKIPAERAAAILATEYAAVQIATDMQAHAELDTPK